LVEVENWGLNFGAGDARMPDVEVLVVIPVAIRVIFGFGIEVKGVPEDFLVEVVDAIERRRLDSGSGHSSTGVLSIADRL
jgi:hypothetical protein